LARCGRIIPRSPNSSTVQPDYAVTSGTGAWRRPGLLIGCPSLGPCRGWRLAAGLAHPPVAEDIVQASLRELAATVGVQGAILIRHLNAMAGGGLA
jgi:hypothetical protein